MRTIPFDSVTAHGIHWLITIELFAGTLRLTTFHDDVVIDGVTWHARGAVNVTQILYTSDGSPAAADIRIAPDEEAVFSSWGARGYLEGLPILLEIFDVNNPSAGRYNMVPGATIGSCSEDTNKNIVIAALGKLSLLRANMLEVFTISCKAFFGDDRCKIPLDVPVVARGTEYITQAGDADEWQFTRQVFARVFQSGSYNDLVYECTTRGTTHATTQPTYPVVNGGTVTDGTAVFTARTARLVAVTGEGLDFTSIQLDTNPTPEPTRLGKIIPQDGPLAGIKIPIRAYDSGTQIVTTFEPFAPSSFPPGTNFLIHPGCDKLKDTCKDEYNNLNNFRGTPYAPRADNISARA